MHYNLPFIIKEENEMMNRLFAQEAKSIFDDLKGKFREPR